MSSALLLAAFLLKLGRALWAVDRGYEMGDEGYFLLSLNHPESTPAAFEFPADFPLVRTLRFPYEEVYATFDAPGISHVHLHAPRRRSGEAEAP